MLYLFVWFTEVATNSDDCDSDLLVLIFTCKWAKKGSILLVYTDGIAVVLELRYLHYEKNGLDIDLDLDAGVIRG